MNVSLIIPSWNEERDIERCIISWLSQTILQYEILVIDSSADSTPEIVKRIAKEHPEANIKYFYIPKTNVATARNYGAEKAQGEILIFNDADALMQDDKVIEKVQKTFSDTKVNISCICGNLMAVDTFWQKCSLIRSILSRFHSSIFKGAKKENLFVNCIRKSAFEAIGGFTPAAWYEDLEFGKKAKKMFGRIYPIQVNVLVQEPATFNEIVKQNKNIGKGLLGGYLAQLIKDRWFVVIIPPSPLFWMVYYSSFFLYQPLFIFLSLILLTEVVIAWFMTRNYYPEKFLQFLLPSVVQVFLLYPFKAFYFGLLTLNSLLSRFQ